MSPGAHAARGGSFGRSAGTAALRGALLIAVAVGLGIVLLAATDDDRSTVGTGDDGVEAPAPESGDEGGSGTTTPSPGTDTTPPPATPRPPAEVRVLVANGSGVQGSATRYKDQLAGAGYNALAPTNATTRPLPSVLYFAPGFELEAAAIAATLQPPPPVEAMPAEPPVDDIGEADVLLVVGPELAPT